ncbi:MAG: NUDIX hydrolase [Butyrivibrio sp.]|jgi:ADP-ribose pyrophosphatase|nr:NUDIX hydrolase [Butyrivibrio sp.]
MEKISKEQIKALFESKFLRVFDIQYAEGKHYYNATRRPADRLAAVMSREQFQNMVPDAVSCFVVIKEDGKEPVLLLTKEFRYPVGRYVLSVPAGLIDPEDENKENPQLAAAARELHEETGIVISETDSLKLVNPLVFSTPGMTDESNALVCAVVHLSGSFHLTQEGAVGSEKFDGFVPLTKAEAEQMLKTGRDAEGNFYSAYTWMALMYFVSGMWEA